MVDSQRISFLEYQSLVLIVTFQIAPQIALYNRHMRATTQHTKAILQAIFVTILWSTSMNVVSSLFSREMNRDATLPPLVVTFASM